MIMKGGIVLHFMIVPPALQRYAAFSLMKKMLSSSPPLKAAYLCNAWGYALDNSFNVLREEN